MLFPTPPATAEDIRLFCARFNEGIRVEYKGPFDGNVRNNIAKIVSSFANSLGGVLVIGVNAVNGVPQQPIEGFTTPNEELELVIEQICLQAMNPPVVVKTTVIPSDVQGRSFLVVEVEESWEAPHALENSTKVYVRTGNAANPYELSKVDLIIELMRRRAAPETKRETLIAKAQQRAREILNDFYVQVSLCPTYPRRPLSTREQVWEFATNRLYRGEHYLPVATLRRVDDGILSLTAGWQAGIVTTDGVLLLRRLLQLQGNNTVVLGEIFNPVLKMLHMASEFYQAHGYAGDVTVALRVDNVAGRDIPFLAGEALRVGDERFRCAQRDLSALDAVPSERLRQDIIPITRRLMHEICWTCWQDNAEYPAERLDRYLADTIRAMNVGAA